MARHVLRIALVLQHAMALRAALESAVQLGRGDEGNRQADMANPTKCRDSLQQSNVATRSSPHCARNILTHVAAQDSCTRRTFASTRFF
jgi:hypothetical protein